MYPVPGASLGQDCTDMVGVGDVKVRSYSNRSSSNLTDVQFHGNPSALRESVLSKHVSGASLSWTLVVCPRQPAFSDTSGRVSLKKNDERRKHTVLGNGSTAVHSLYIV